MSRPIQQLDEYESGLAPSLLRELDIRGCQQFESAHPEYYASDRNGDLLIGWIESRGVCYSLRNLEAAYYDLLEQHAFEERPPDAVEAPADNFVQRLTHNWGKDTRPKSATGMVLDPKTAEEQAKAAAERKARVVERQSEPVPSLSVEEARKLAPLPQGEDRRNQTLKQLKKDRQLDISELRDAATAERIAIARSKGNYPPRS